MSERQADGHVRQTGGQIEARRDREGTKQWYKSRIGVNNRDNRGQEIAIVGIKNRDNRGQQSRKSGSKTAIIGVINRDNRGQEIAIIGVKNRDNRGQET